MQHACNAALGAPRARMVARADLTLVAPTSAARSQQSSKASCVSADRPPAEEVVSWRLPGRDPAKVGFRLPGRGGRPPPAC
eukprot:9917980-Alexandrium_andersonii.AAC.1